MSTSAKEIKVDVLNLEYIFKGKAKVIIPEYQRPYEWGKEKTAELLADLKEFFIEKNSNDPYYLGTVLFYYNASQKTYEIIDGQQRITTLLILKNVLNKSLAKNQNITFNSYISLNGIRETTDYAKREMALLNKLNDRDFLNHIEFTQVITHSQDDSFAFFDTQNNRGIKLGATDYLKAYHLREIASVELQEACAKKWENAGTNWIDGDYLLYIFNKILFRARVWRSKNVPFENDDLILDTFQKRTLLPESSYAYPLFPNIYNRQSLQRTYNDEGKFKDLENLNPTNNPEYFPFSLRQPVYKGLQFFHFTEKYLKLHDLLFKGEGIKGDEIGELKLFFNAVYNSNMSVYLRDLFKLSVIMYYDIFEMDGLLKFAYHLDYLLGSTRVNQSVVKKESAQKCLTDPSHNLLDIIAHAYTVQEIMEFIKGIPGKDTIYKKMKTPAKNGVQDKYRKRVMKYFGKNATEFKNRKSWLNEK